MTTINFVPKDDRDKTWILKIRHMVVVATTAVLGVYLIGVAGLFGWWWYKSSREKKVSARIEELVMQIGSLSGEEAAARRLNDRTVAIQDFLKNRGQASEAARILNEAENAEVTGWVYNAGGGQSVRVKAEGPGQVFEFGRYLETRYGVVQVDEAGWTVKDGWYGQFLASGMKKGEI